MRSTGRVLVPDACELLLPKAGSSLHESRPQPPVHVRDLAVDQLAHQYIRTVADRLRSLENLPTLWMAPPTAADRTAGNRLREARDRAPSGLKDHAMPLDEVDRFLRAH